MSEWHKQLLDKKPLLLRLLIGAKTTADSAYRKGPWWVLARDVFNVGLTSGHEICRSAGINPNATVSDPLPPETFSGINEGES